MALADSRHHVLPDVVYVIVAQPVIREYLQVYPTGGDTVGINVHGLLTH